MSDLVRKADGWIELVESGQAEASDVIAMIDAVDSVKRELASVVERFEAAAIKWIAKNGEVECGDMRYYVASKSTKKPKDTEATVRKILEASGGDLATLTSCLSPNPFKISGIAALLGKKEAEAEFDRIFHDDLATGRPRIGLKRVNKHFAQGDHDEA